MICMSACLAGVNCRYDGTHCKNKKAIKLIDNQKVLLVCPEQLGGLTTPRIPCEIYNNKVIGMDGNDYTNEFINGAKKVYELMIENNINEIILKDKSPSCGVVNIYNGQFNGVLVKGKGITANYLISKGMIVHDESYLESI